MAAILSCRARLNHRPLRRGCLIEFSYPRAQGRPSGAGVLRGSRAATGRA